MAGKKKRCVRVALVGPTMALIVLLGPTQADAAGELDPGFGGDGTVTTDLGGTEKAFSVAIQVDGRIVVAVGDFAGGFALARYLPGGSLDPEFGHGGVVTTDFGQGSTVRAVAIQSDGRIVAAGSAVTSTGADFALARYLPDGSLDRTFGDDGRVTTHFGGEGFTQNDSANAVAIQADGRILAAGTGAGEPRAPDFALARYRPDGSLDPSFGRGGLVTTDIGRSAEAVNALALDADGKVVAAGEMRNLSRGEGVFALARYHPDGSLDSSFSGDGTLTFQFPNADSSIALDVAIQPDGRIVVAGQDRGSTVLGRPRAGFALARLLPDGSLDPTFGNSGTVQTDFGSESRGRSVVIQANGRIVMAGTGGLGFALARYLPDGSPDPAFGDRGRITTDLGDAAMVFDMTIDGNGRIVVVGSSGDDLALARYLAEDFETCAGRSPTIVGTAGDDTITGTAGADVILGLGGNDMVFAGPGDDVVCGGEGNDTVAGGLDNDTLFGGGGNDFLDGGGLGPDPVQATADYDRLFGGPGDDTLWSADFGRVDAAGGDGDDYLFGGPNADRLQGGPGNDTMEGRAGDDLLSGGDGTDRVLAGAGDDRIDVVDLVRRNDEADGQEGTDDCIADPEDMVVNCP